MLDVRCYKVTNGVFDGNVEERWVQMFIDENYEDEYDADADFRFLDMKTICGMPIFKTKTDIDVDKLKKELKNISEKYVPQFILLTEYEQFKQIIEASTYNQISSVEVAVTQERTIMHYAVINFELQQNALLVAV